MLPVMEPTFTFSLDTEMMWGSFDKLSTAEFEQRYPDIRGTIAQILDLLDAFEIPTTWAVVGHLFHEACERGPDGRTHPEIIRPDFEWYPDDWLGQDPGSDRHSDPLWYGPDILDRIQGAKVAHEIGSHSFSHAPFGDPGMSEEAARSELEACVRAAEQRGIQLRSFVFPRNREGHHELLREHGFTSFRGADQTWYGSMSGMASRGAHLVDQSAAMTPRVHRPTEALPGLWDIPGSMLLLHRVGVRRWVSVRARVRKAERGIEQAIREGAVFHLWTHPMNLAHDREAMMKSLELILRAVAERRDEGLLRVRTMHDLAVEAVAAVREPKLVRAIAPDVSGPSAGASARTHELGRRPALGLAAASAASERSRWVVIAIVVMLTAAAATLALTIEDVLGVLGSFGLEMNQPLGEG